VADRPTCLGGYLCNLALHFMWHTRNFSYHK
jgi:hypothetical protein